VVHITARRIDGGEPLREAMFQRGVGLKALALRTQAADPDGKGISWQLAGFLATRHSWARETTTPRTAQLIEQALAVPEGSLFEVITVRDRIERQPEWSSL
jgi:hypothetical protein